MSSCRATNANGVDVFANQKETSAKRFARDLRRALRKGVTK